MRTERGDAFFIHPVGFNATYQQKSMVSGGRFQIQKVSDELYYVDNNMVVVTDTEPLHRPQPAPEPSDATRKKYTAAGWPWQRTGRR